MQMPIIALFGCVGAEMSDMLSGAEMSERLALWSGRSMCCVGFKCCDRE